jgi:hypothetical protein
VQIRSEIRADPNVENCLNLLCDSGQMAMPNVIECKSFSPVSYPGVNGTLALAASHVDVSRALITVGYPSFSAALTKVGPWRVQMLRAMANGYIDHSLSVTQYFRNLESSERGAVTFLLAQAFTLHFAQQYMKLSYLVHVRGANAVWAKTNSGANVKPGAGRPKTKSLPDFIGYAPGEVHVFETKGRTRRLWNKFMSSALAQASLLQL